MKYDITILSNLTKELNGLSKFDAYQILHKIETALYYANSPLDQTELISVISDSIPLNRNIDPFHFKFLPNGKAVDFIGANNWIQVYKPLHQKYFSTIFNNGFYYRTKYKPLTLKKLNKKNILRDLKSTKRETKILEFLKKNKISKVNPVTNKMLILDI